MPYPNFHTCRIADPSEFDPKTYGQDTRKHDGKEYSVLYAAKKDGGSSAEQAYRYPKDVWTAASASAHCKTHGGSFEAASGKPSGKESIFEFDDYYEGVSTKSWASVDKSSLPKSAFLWIEGDGKTKDQWHLPYKDEEGNINLGALRAISAAIAGARTGTPMDVPSEVKTKLDALLKKYNIGQESVRESYVNEYDAEIAVLGFVDECFQSF